MEFTRAELQDAFERVESRIRAACERASRPRESVTLLPVSKMHSAELIQSAYDFGYRKFGESRVQELLVKQQTLPADIEWHFIGHLQSNKAKNIAPFVSMVHSIDSVETGVELSKRALAASRTIDVLIEINISGEQAKDGVEPTAAEALLMGLREQTRNLRVCGLMCVAGLVDDDSVVREQFRSMKILLERLQISHSDLSGFQTLSMGMTHDLEIAIEEGATIIRVGSAIFGDRE
ncbi:MAG: YggS family pyridoxal phosphate-dependent enzyme [Candidatus Kapaibacterium sp.]|jgi:pyridoxal phosphate enzyme (YggS family)